MRFALQHVSLLLCSSSEHGVKLGGIMNLLVSALFCTGTSLARRVMGDEAERYIPLIRAKKVQLDAKTRLAPGVFVPTSV